MIRNLTLAFAALCIFLTSMFGYAITVGPGDIKKNAVRSKHIKKNNVKSSDIKNRGVKTKDLADGVVTREKIAAGAVGEAEIEDGAVTAAKLSGSTILAAYVSDKGQFRAGTAGTKAKRDSQDDGKYFVTFPVPVGECVHLATLSYLEALPGSEVAAVDTIRTSTLKTLPNDVIVHTSDGGTGTDASFSVVAFCL